MDAHGLGRQRPVDEQRSPGGEQVEQVAGECPRVSVGAYNGPNTVLSGPGEDLEQVVAKFSEDGVRCTWLETSHAFHS